MSLPPVEAAPAVIFPVVNSSAPPPAISPPSPLAPTVSLPVVKHSRVSRSTLTALGVGAGLGGLVVLVAVAIFVFFYRRKKRKMLDALPTTKQDYFHPPKGDGVVPQPPNPTHQPGVHPAQSPESIPVIISSGESVATENRVSGETFSTFSYEELARITDNFSNANLLGQGGFGFVHKGILPNGKEVAIKQLKAGSGQGEREFQAEVETITRVDHKHLVQLHGHCICGEKRLLVYEYLPNNTMEFHLHGEGRPPLCWETRLKIAVGTAKGLAYLHEECQPKIIHRDIKASNILLDDDFEVKGLTIDKDRQDATTTRDVNQVAQMIKGFGVEFFEEWSEMFSSVADFGLAKFSYDNDTHVSTRVMGTFGYLAPEYASSGKLTEKSDVFSFGVVLLELITGRRPVDKTHSFMDDSMVEWARPLLMEALETGNFDRLADPRLEDYNPTEMTHMVACASVCVRQSARRRPRMSQIVRVLEGNLSANDICKEKSPASSSVYGSSDFDHSQQYKEEMKKFRKLALDSQDQSTTSEFSAVASEYDAQPSTTTSTERDTKEMGGKRDGGDGYVIPIS